MWQFYETNQQNETVLKTSLGKTLNFFIVNKQAYSSLIKE